MKIFLILLLLGVVYVITSSFSCDDSCCNGHGDYELMHVIHEEKTTIFSCKNDENITEYYEQGQYRDMQAKKTYDYITNELKNDEVNKSQALIFNRELTLEKFGCQVIY